MATTGAKTLGLLSRNPFTAFGQDCYATFIRLTLSPSSGPEKVEGALRSLSLKRRFTPQKCTLKEARIHEWTLGGLIAAQPWKFCPHLRSLVIVQSCKTEICVCECFSKWSLATMRFLLDNSLQRGTYLDAFSHAPAPSNAKRSEVTNSAAKRWWA